MIEMHGVERGLDRGFIARKVAWFGEDEVPQRARGRQLGPGQLLQLDHADEFMEN